ncbi:MAG: cob(I)yrinic acid a,c-diamide adenosyltransferase [Patescibacteria group bacterium]
MSVYTKTGDKGETGLVSSDPNKPIRISKSSAKIEVIGSIDELNSVLGILVSNSEDQELCLILKDIQANLFTIGAIIAGSKLEFSSDNTKHLEKLLDKWEGSLPVLKNFILPGGSQEAAWSFFARAVTRRAERNLVALSKKENINPEILKYINRLSDLLFILGRKINNSQGVGEIKWAPLKSPQK